MASLYLNPYICTNIKHNKKKNLNKFNVIFYSFLFSFFPRLTIFYAYYFNYDDVASIFFNSLHNKKPLELMPSAYAKFESNQLHHSSNWQTLFSFYKFPFMQLKYYVDMYFKESNRSACFCITVNCLSLTFIDLILFIDFLRSFLA